MTDLLSLVLTLKPLNLPADSAPRGWWGRAAQALLLSIAAQKDPALAEKLHEGTSAIRPFTVSTLMGKFGKGILLPEETYALRLTAFSSELAQCLSEAADSGGLRVGATVELDYQPFEIVAHADSPWASRMTYEQLSAPFLLAKREPPRYLTLTLASPTTFKSGGKHAPLPTPALVFGSLLERWNAYAPVTFPPEARRYAEECLAVSRFHLRTKSVPQKDSGLRVGAVGSVSFTSVSYDRYWMSVMATLAQFALFGGLGAGTAQGLGQCRLMIED